MNKISSDSRADYFRELRKKKRQLVFMVDPEKADKLDEKLKSENKSRTSWFREVLDKEIGEQ